MIHAVLIGLYNSDEICMDVGVNDVYTCIFDLIGLHFVCVGSRYERADRNSESTQSRGN